MLTCDRMNCGTLAQAGLSFSGSQTSQVKKKKRKISNIFLCGIEVDSTFGPLPKAGEVYTKRDSRKIDEVISEDQTNTVVNPV